MSRAEPPKQLSAAAFLRDLQQRQSEVQRENYGRYFKMGAGEYGEGDVFIGVPMGEVFALAKQYIDMPVGEIEKLMESEIHEARAGAMSIMDKAGRSRKTSAERRQALYELYLRRHDRINNWDLVDLAAQHVVGRYLEAGPRDVLYALARSESMWERRTAIVATAYFLRQGDVEETFKIAEMLLDDDEDLIHKAVGGWLRQAGKQAPERLLAFLVQHAARMPRAMLTYAMEHLDADQKAHYRGLVN